MNPVVDLNECRKRILTGEAIPPEVLYAHIKALREQRFEKVVKKEEARMKKGKLSETEHANSLSIFDNL